MKAPIGIIGIGASVAIALASGCATTSVSSKPSEARSAARASDLHCASESASRIPSDSSSCRTAGRSYSSEDIDRTGKTSAAEALAVLDPSVSVGR
jgi:hypothetical protein